MISSQRMNDFQFAMDSTPTDPASPDGALARILDADGARIDVLASFFRQLGWQPSDCISANLANASRQSSPSFSIPPEWSALKPEGARQMQAAIAIVHVAALLDQSGASAESFLTAVPAWLVDRNAALGVFLARAQIRGREFTQAEATLRLALELNPVSGVAQRQLGLLLWRRGATIEASNAFSASLALQTTLQFDATTQAKIPLLVAQPSASVDIYLYDGMFYVYRRERDTFGVRVIAGELFDIRHTAALRFARALLRYRMLRWLFIGTGRHASASPVKHTLVPLRKWGPVRALAPSLRAAVGALLRGTARVLFARPILLRTATITQALRFSTGLDSVRVAGKE